MYRDYANAKECKSANNIHRPLQLEPLLILMHWSRRSKSDLTGHIDFARLLAEMAEFSPEGEDPTLFSLSDLQESHSIEEIVNNTCLNLKVNHNVLSELKAAYKSFEHAKGWPQDLSDKCRGDLIRFEQRITSIQNDMAIQQSQVETLSRLIADRKSLVGISLLVSETADNFR